MGRNSRSTEYQSPMSPLLFNIRSMYCPTIFDIYSQHFAHYLECTFLIGNVACNRIDMNVHTESEARLFPINHQQ